MESGDEHTGEREREIPSLLQAQEALDLLLTSQINGVSHPSPTQTTPVSIHCSVRLLHMKRLLAY